MILRCRVADFEIEPMRRSLLFRSLETQQGRIQALGEIA